MKKLLFKVILLTGLLLAVPYYMLKGGEMPGFISDLFKSGKEKVTGMKGMGTVTTDQEVTLYKCTSATGHIEYSQSPCYGEGEIIHLKPNVNIVQRTQIPEAEESESTGGSVITLGDSDDAKAKAKDKEDKKDGALDLGNPYDPANIQKLVKDAKNIGNVLEQRNQKVESTTQQR